jgi:hypothetical protein
MLQHVKSILYRSIKGAISGAVLIGLTTAIAQEDQTYATFITEEQWQHVNELPGVDRQIVSRDIGKLNLSVGIVHRGAVARGSGRDNENPERPCGTQDNARNSGARGIMHIHQTETYYIASGSGTLVTGGEIYNGNGFADDSVVNTTLNGPSCSGLIVGDWIAKHVKEGDIIIIPAGTPHGWLEVPVHVDYLSVRPDPDRVLPDDYINPALGPNFKLQTEQ